MKDRRALEAAYRAAVYRIATDPPIDVTIGRSSAATAALLRWAGVEHAAIVTAHNPGSEHTSAEANDAADRTLRAGLEARGYPTRDSVATDPAGAWPDEPGCLVLGMGADEARVLGRAFGQNAVVIIDAGGNARIEWCRDDRGAR